MKLKTLSNKFCIVALIILLSCTKSEVGPSGLASLVKVTQEAAGANCANGGFKIETGIDKNKNSVLDTDEIQNTAYVCNGTTGVNGTTGTNGTNGTDGLTSLIKVTAETAGTNCSAGGYRIDTGIDDNADGILQTSEIDNTIYVCNGSGGDLVNYGKTTLVLANDITDAQAAQIIASDLGTATQEVKIIGTTHLKTVDLSKLESAISIQVAGNDSLKTLDLSGLKSIEGSLHIDSSPQLANLDFSSLQNMILTDYSYIYAYNTQLTNISFPSLAKVELVSLSSNGGCGLEIDANDNQQLSVSFPELTEIISNDNYGAVIISGASVSMPKLIKSNTYIGVVKAANSSLAFPELVEADDLYIMNGSSVTTLSLPLLTQGSVRVNAISLTTFSIPKFTTGNVSIENSALTSLTIPEWTKGSLSIGNGGSLASVSVPKLAALTGLNIQGSPNLSGLTLPTLAGLGGSFGISGSNLSSTSVNAILANLVQITPAITGAQITLQMNPAAPPTGQGITDKATLVANGNSVATD